MARFNKASQRDAVNCAPAGGVKREDRMSKLTELLTKAQEGKSLQEKLWGKFPVEIYKDCGPEEIQEILERIDSLSKEKLKVEQGDGDSYTDLSKAQGGFSELLEKLTSKYPNEILQGLSSSSEDTAFWVVHAFLKSPNKAAVAPLSQYLLQELPEFYRDAANQALVACKNKQNILNRVFGK